MTTHHDQYNEWKQARASVEAPEGFSDKVMSAVDRYENHRTLFLLGLFQLAANSRSTRIAAWSVTVLACLIKIVIPAAIVLVP